MDQEFHSIFSLRGRNCHSCTNVAATTNESVSSFSTDTSSAEKDISLLPVSSSIVPSTTTSTGSRNGNTTGKGGGIGLISRVRRSLSSAGSSSSNRQPTPSQLKPAIQHSSSAKTSVLSVSSNTSSKLTENAMAAVKEEEGPFLPQSPAQETAAGLHGLTAAPRPTLRDAPHPSYCDWIPGSSPKTWPESKPLNKDVISAQQHYQTTVNNNRSPPSSPLRPNRNCTGGISCGSSTLSANPNASETLYQEKDAHDLEVAYHKTIADARRSKRKNFVVAKDVPVLPAPSPAMYWSRPTVHGTIPRPMRAHTSVAVDDLMYVFGGADSHGCLWSLYILEMDTFKWLKPKVRGVRPPPSRGHTAVADPERSRIYVFGGGDKTSYTSDLYILDIVSMNWTKPDTKGTPPPKRRAHTAFIWRGCMYIFGGGDGSRALNDLHALDLQTLTWSLVETTGSKPVARGYHSSCLVQDQLIVYGGSDGHGCFGDVHVLNLELKIWTRVETDIAPEFELPLLPKRLAHASVNVGSYLFVTGGHDGNRYCNDLLLLNLTTMAWESRKVYGQAPAPRGYHTMLLHDSRLFMFGGYDGKTFYNEVYILDLSASAYLPQITNFSINIAK